LEFLASLEKNQELHDKCKVVLVVPSTISPEAKNQLLSRGASAIVTKPISDESMQSAFEKIGLGY
jgi:cysteine synthase